MMKEKIKNCEWVNSLHDDRKKCSNAIQGGLKRAVVVEKALRIWRKRVRECVCVCV